MLRYTECSLSLLEIPNEINLCIYLSGCPNHCPECHYPELQHSDYGDELESAFERIIEAFSRRVTCVCFMGEGDSSISARTELVSYANSVRKQNLRVALYSGRDTEIEEWMACFDYVKVGSYQKEHGDLSCRTTNQVLYQKTCNGYADITELFWT